MANSRAKPAFAMLLDRAMHGVWGQVQFTRPGNGPEFHKYPLKYWTIPQARENARLR
jgi:hypothetical protein